MTVRSTPAGPVDVVLEQSDRVLRSYAADPGLIEEHANSERRIAQGGYGDRQIFELVQNAADELRERHGGEIAVILTKDRLYCANEGLPVSSDGIDTILRMSTSKKRGGQIGRFGVGVKSVLAISNGPEFFSAYAGQRFGFGFDRAWSAERIREVVPEAGETPVLRMARLLDVACERAADPTLEQLLDWATTVVRLPLMVGVSERLGRDLQDFPREFPLFSPHVGTITLIDRRDQVFERRIDQRSAGNRHIIEVSLADSKPTEYRWRVFTTTHRPSPEALGSAGELHNRPEIDISWAVPHNSQTRGVFWSYFPTKFATTLRGILNAPWKTSEDRQAIFDGNPFNDELIRIAAALVIDSIPSLNDPKDPASFIDYLPGRGREAPQFADERLTTAIWTAAATRPSLVDQDGRFCRPADLRLHPEDIREDWLREWASCPARPADWVHHSADRRERRPRVRMIFEKAGRQAESTVVEWLEALTAFATPKASAAALRIAAAMVTADHKLAADARNARILLTEGGAFVAPVAGEVFRRSGDTVIDGLSYVDDRVAAEFGTASALDVLGVREADASGRFAAVVDRGFDGYDEDSWTSFWEMTRSAGSVAALGVLRSQPDELRAAIRVRTASGGFAPVASCLLPGPVVPGDGSRDGSIAVDDKFHAVDLPILRYLGLTDRPVLEEQPHGAAWFEDYCEYYWKKYLRGLEDGEHRPQLKTMRFDGPPSPGPLAVFAELSDDGRAAFLGALPAATSVSRWTMQVGKQQGTRQPIASPLTWLARSIGSVHTSRGVRSVLRAVGPALSEYGGLLPVAELGSGVAAALLLPDSLERIRERTWASLVAEAAESHEDGFPGALYSLMMRAAAPWPDGGVTRCRVGDDWATDVPDQNIAVTALSSEYVELRRERIPALLAPSSEDAELIIDTWDMLAPGQVIFKEIRHVAESPGQSLGEVFPALRMRHRQKIDGVVVVRCTEIEEITRTPNGITPQSRRSALEGRNLLVLRPDGDEDVLIAADEVLRLGLGPDGQASVLKQKEQQARTDLQRRVRLAGSTEEKLVELIGEEQLRAGLPQGLVEAERARGGDAPSALRVAELALHTHGPSILRHHAKHSAATDESSPRSFNGSTRARQYVASLGLPEEFAGAAEQTPPDMEEVDGPTDLPSLHDFQELVAARMVEHLLSPVPSRAMLSLPTGAGKTRVAVEAVTRFVRERGVPAGPVLWIAQSNELCEQAVESWKFVWTKAGPNGRLVINRFWGGRDAAPVTGTTQLVVATDATLNSRLDRPSYEWLRRAALVIVDEAHRGISPEYTRILGHLGIDRAHTERPLIGLSATPFRGRSEQQTNWLVNRFGGRRLDEGIFEAGREYEDLQERGILASVEHRELAGSTIELDAKQMSEAKQFSTLPSAVEEGLARDGRRNETLLSAITRLPETWSILVFAASVEHSKLMTALLNGRGVSSVSLDASVPPAERRRVVEGYREGRFRVITNYNVLAQGFDAPRTNAVVIARPTFSPNAYQQMIGRGLRGPLNGGQKTCLILDVRDNVRNYGGDLAFTEFEYLWRKR